MPEENWCLPPKNALEEYVGRKSAEKHKKSSSPTVAIEDKELLELINSLPIDIDKSKGNFVLEIEQWNLLERIKLKDPLLSMKAGAGDAFKNLLEIQRSMETTQRTAWCSAIFIPAFL